MCDLAEVLLRRRKEAEDMLRLLADLARHDDYETPGEALEEALAAEEGRPANPALRYAQVQAALMAAGGDG